MATDPLTIPSSGHDRQYLDGLYRARAGAAIDYAEAKAHAATVYGRLLLLAVAEVAPDLRDAQVRIHPEYREAVDLITSAYARLEQADAAVEASNALQRERRLVLKERAQAQLAQVHDVRAEVESLGAQLRSAITDLSAAARSVTARTAGDPAP